MQNLRMHNGQKSQADIERHANAWIKAHQKPLMVGLNKLKLLQNNQ